MRLRRNIFLRKTAQISLAVILAFIFMNSVHIHQGMRIVGCAVCSCPECSIDQISRQPKYHSSAGCPACEVAALGSNMVLLAHSEWIPSGFCLVLMLGALTFSLHNIKPIQTTPRAPPY